MTSTATDILLPTGGKELEINTLLRIANIPLSYLTKKPTMSGGDVARLLNISYRSLHEAVKRHDLEPCGRRTAELKDMSFKLRDVATFKIALDAKVAPSKITSAMNEAQAAFGNVHLFERPKEFAAPSAPPHNPKYQHTESLGTLGDIMPTIVKPVETQAQVIPAAPAPAPIIEAVKPESLPPTPQPETTTVQTEELLGSEEARKLINMKTGTFYGRVGNGYLPFEMKDGKKMFKKSDVLTFKEIWDDEQRKKQTPPKAEKPATVAKPSQKGTVSPNLAKAHDARRLAGDKARIARGEPPKFFKDLAAAPPNTPTTPTPSGKLSVVIYKPETLKLTSKQMEMLTKVIKGTRSLSTDDVKTLSILAMLHDGPSNPFQQIVDAINSGMTVDLR